MLFSYLSVVIRHPCVVSGTKSLLQQGCMVNHPVARVLDSSKKSAAFLG